MKKKIGTKELIGRSASDLIGLNPLDNAVFFIASALHLNEISKSLEITAQQMFMKVRVTLIFKEIRV